VVPEQGFTPNLFSFPYQLSLNHCYVFKYHLDQAARHNISAFKMGFNLRFLVSTVKFITIVIVAVVTVVMVLIIVMR
jgi:hypothetical protein